jgi:hypothetical protein
MAATHTKLRRLDRSGARKYTYLSALCTSAADFQCWVVPSEQEPRVEVRHNRENSLIV